MTVKDIVERAVFDEEYGEGDRFLDAPDDLEGQLFAVWTEDVAEVLPLQWEGNSTGGSASADPAPVSAFTDSGLGTLPANASAADRRDEPFAHEAAKLVRQGIGLAEALRRVAPSDPSRVPSSVERVIRATFDKMYDKRGEVLIRK
jgi:hypothetical protein